MAQLFNRQTNSLEDVPDTNVSDAILSGNYGFKKGQMIPVISADGNFGEISAEELPNALQQGFQFEGFDTRTKRIEAKEFDRPFQAGLAGAARGATFGLSDQALTKTGLVEPETLRKLEEYNPTSSIVGEIGGIGATLPIKLSPAGLAASTGQAVTRFATKEATSTAAKIAAKAGAAGAGSAVEGAFYGAGHVISDDALQKPEASAEDIIGQIGLSALLGGGLGASFRAAADASPFIYESAKKAAAPMFRYTTDKAIDAYAKLSGFVSGADSKQIKDLLSKPFTKEGYEQRKVVADYLENREAKAQELANLLQKNGDAIKAIEKEHFKDGGRAAERMIIADDVPVVTAVQKANEVITKTSEVIKDMRKDIAYYSKSKIDKMEEELSQFAKVLNDDLQKQGNATNIFNRVDDFKRRLDVEAKFGFNIPPREAETVARFRDLRSEVKNILEDETIWGASAARQAAVNNSFNAFKTAEKPYLQKFGTTKVDKFGNKIRVFSPEKLNRYATQIHKQMGSEKEEILRTYLDASANLADTIASGKILRQGIEEFDNRFGTLGAGASSKGVVDSAQGVKKQIDEEISKINKFRQTKWYTERPQGMDLAAVAGGVGSVVSGLVSPAVGAAALGVYGALRDPAKMVRVLTWLEKTIKLNDKRIQTAVDNFAKGTEQAANISRRALLSESTVKSSKEEGPKLLASNEEERQKRFEKKQKMYSDFANNPDLLIAKMAENTGELNESAPSTAMALDAKVANAVQYLNSKLPKNPFPSNLFTRKWIPSQSEIAKFDRIERVINDPLSVLDDLNEGKISKDSVDTLKEFAPETYQKIVSKFISKLSEQKEPLPYNKRIQLSVVLGVPLDPSVDPSYVASIQALYAPTNNQPQQPTSNPTNINVGQLSKAQMPNAVATPFQQTMLS